MTRKPTETVWQRVKEALLDDHREGKQSEAANICGIKQPSVNLWNKPGGAPKLEHARKLAHTLNVCVEWIYTGRGPKRPEPQDPETQELWRIWAKLDAINRARVVAYAQGKAEAALSAPRIGASFE